MNISHISDLHGKPPRGNKSADILIISGDLAPNNVDNFAFYYKGALIPQKRVSQLSRLGMKAFDFRKIDTKAEAIYQTDWIHKVALPTIKQRGFALDDVIFVNGNHDFFDPTDIFPNSLFQGSKTITLGGKKFGLVSGVLPYVNEWNDEVSDDVIQERIASLDPDIDALVTHVPPYGILDDGYDAVSIGSQSVARAIFGKHSSDTPYFTKLRLHTFGHAHDSRGKAKHEIEGRHIVFSNASETRFDLSL